MEGADGFILKPYMPDDLVARIREALGASLTLLTIHLILGLRNN